MHIVHDCISTRYLIAAKQQKNKIYMTPFAISNQFIFASVMDMSSQAFGILERN